MCVVLLSFLKLFVHPQPHKIGDNGGSATYDNIYSKLLYTNSAQSRASRTPGWLAFRLCEVVNPKHIGKRDLSTFFLFFLQ